LCFFAITIIKSPSPNNTNPNIHNPVLSPLGLASPVTGNSTGVLSAFGFSSVAVAVGVIVRAIGGPIVDFGGGTDVNSPGITVTVLGCVSVGSSVSVGTSVLVGAGVSVGSGVKVGGTSVGVAVGGWGGGGGGGQSISASAAPNHNTRAINTKIATIKSLTINFSVLLIFHHL